MSARPLPEQFAELAPFVEDWAQPTERERYRKLHTSTIQELRAFYDAMLPRMDAILDWLDQFDVNELPPDARTLYELAMTFAETAHPIDLRWPHVDFTDAYPWERFEFRTVSCRP
jgi:hypothetical protein